MENKREKSWQSMSISNEVFDKLDVVRAKTEKEIGMKLSWTRFFSHFMRKLEDLEAIVVVQQGKPATSPAPKPKGLAKA